MLKSLTVQRSTPSVHRDGSVFASTLIWVYFLAVGAVLARSVRYIFQALDILLSVSRRKFATFLLGGAHDVP